MSTTFHPKHVRRIAMHDNNNKLRLKGRVLNMSQFRLVNSQNTSPKNDFDIDHRRQILDKFLKLKPLDKSVEKQKQFNDDNPVIQPTRNALNKYQRTFQNFKNEKLGSNSMSKSVSPMQKSLQKIPNRSSTKHSHKKLWINSRNRIKSEDLKSMTQSNIKIENPKVDIMQNNKRINEEDYHIDTSKVIYRFLR